MKGRDPLTWAAVLLGVVAFVGSFEHVSKTVAHHGQRGWLAVVIALMPELSVVLAVLKLRRDGVGQLWPWLAGGSAVAFTVAANLAQAESSLWGVVVAGWPAWSAVSAAALIEFRADEPAAVTALEEPRTSPAPPAITSGQSTPPSDASVSGTLPEAAPVSAPAPRPRRTTARSGGGRKPAPKLPALTDAEALEIGVRVFRDVQPANRDEYARAFRAVRPGESSVIKRSYTPAREAAAKPQLQAV